MNASDWPFPGSRWWKFDFHTHTPASSDYGAGANQGIFLARTYREWLTGYMNAGLNCVAVTDHNCGDWIDPLKAELKKMREEGFPGAETFQIFPGVELTVNGAHFLAVFDPTATTRTISDLLAVARCNNAVKNAEAYCTESVGNICAEVLQRGGLFIPAHVDEPLTGAFKLQGNLSALDPILKLEGVVAMEVRDKEYLPPASYNEAKLRWTRILGSDAHHPAPPAARSAVTHPAFPGSHFTWVKMATPSVEALRLALIDGDGFSIRRSDEEGSFDPFRAPEDFIEEIEIVNARFMGRGQLGPQILRFNPWLNALVGGRGSGKSTVLQFLRLGLRRDAEIAHLDQSSEVRRSFERFRRVSKGRDDEGAVLSDSRVKIIFRHEGERFLIQWPDIAGQPSVQEWDELNGRWRGAKSQSVADRFRVRIFSQGQIALLAGEKSQALLDIVNQAVDYPVWKARWDEEERAFLTLRTRIRELEGKLQNRDRVIGSLEDVRRKLARFEEAEHAKVLKEFQVRTRQAKELENQIADANRVMGQLQVLAQELAPTDIASGVFSDSEPLDQQALLHIGQIRGAISAAQSAIRIAAEQLDEAVKAEVVRVKSSGWQAAVAAASTAYHKLVTDLQAQGVQDPSEYGRLTQDRQRLENEVKNLDSLNESVVNLQKQALDQLEALQILRREITAKRQAFLDKVLASNPYVRIELKAYGREPLTTAQSLRTALGISDEGDKYTTDIYLRDDRTEREEGVVAELLKDLPTDEAVSAVMEQRIAKLKENFQEACLGQQTSLGSWFRQRLQKEFGQRQEYLDRILTWFPEDSLAVSYSAKGDGQHFRPITQGSAGQKAAAMLAFLLAYGDEPILVDQPEDDLDNHLIYGLVVRQIRENKQRRQIITVTHNPNIVVNGDAEMVYSLDFIGGQCQVTQKGSLQDADVRDEICRVMEGGRDAFELRYRRIGKGGSRV